MATRIIAILLCLSCAAPAFSQVKSTTTDNLFVKNRLYYGTDTAKYLVSIVQSISAASTHRQSPTAKAVYDYCQSILPTITAGAGISVTGTSPNFTITNTGDTNAADDLTTASTAGGDASGIFSNLTVDGLQTRPISATAPSSGEVLKWNGTAWAPAPDAGGGGHVLMDQGTPFTDRDSLNFLQSTTIDLTLTDNVTKTDFQASVRSNSLTAAEIAADAIGTSELANAAVFGANMAQDGATTGDVWKWNGTAWAPEPDAGGGGHALQDEGFNLTPRDTLNFKQTATINVTLNDTGTRTEFLAAIRANSITDSEIATDAITTTEIANASVMGEDMFQDGATTGDVWKWNGMAWAPAPDAGGATNLTFTENALNDITINSSTGTGFDIAGFGGISIYEDTPGVLAIDATGLGGIAGSIADQQIAYGATTSIAGSDNLKWSGTGVTITKSAIGATQNIANGLLLDNPTNAASLAQQKSPPIVWRGNGWKTTATAASQPIRFMADVLPVQGTSAPSGTWRLSSSINGGAFGDRFAVTSGGFAGIGTITPRRTLEVNGNILFTGNLYDNQDNGLMIQSAVGVTSNRDFTFGNSSYGRYLVSFKSFSLTTGTHPALGSYIFYVNGETATSISAVPSIYFKTQNADLTGNANGGNYIIEFGNGAGTGVKGRFGVGTMTPEACQHIVGGYNTANKYSLIVTNSDASTTSPGICVTDEKKTGFLTNDPKGTVQVVGAGATSGTYSLFVTNSANNTATPTIAARDDDRVGIKTNAPGEALDVNGQGRFDAVDIRDWTVADNVNTGEIHFESGDGTEAPVLTLGDWERRFPIAPITYTFQCIDYNVDWSVGRTKAFWTVPAKYNGWKIYRVTFHVSSIGTGANTVEIEKGGVSQGSISFDQATELITLDQAIATDDIWTFDITSLGSPIAKGLWVEIQLRYN